MGRWGGQRSGGEIAGADTNNQRVRAIGADPAHTIRTLAGNGNPGWRDGPGAQAMFRAPTAVAYGPDGSLYVVDSDNQVIRRIANDPPTYTVTTIAGYPYDAHGYTDRAGAQARFRAQTGMAMDGAAILLADTGNHRIRQIVPGADAQSTAVAARSRAVCFDELQVRQRPGPARAMPLPARGGTE